MPLEVAIITTIGAVINGLIVTTAFTLMARSHAKADNAHAEERRMLINSALSGTAFEFVARQRASEAPSEPVTERPGRVPVSQIDL